MAAAKPLKQTSGSIKEMTSSDKIPVANLATGTPDGTRFVSDAGTLLVPPGTLTTGKVYAMQRGFATQ